MIKAAHALVARGKVPATYLARLGDLDAREHAALSKQAPDVAQSIRDLTIAMRTNRKQSRRDRGKWGKDR